MWLDFSAVLRYHFLMDMLELMKNIEASLPDVTWEPMYGARDESTVFFGMLIFPRFWILKISWLIKRAEHATVNCEFPALHIAKVDLLLELGLLLDTNLLIFLWIIKAWA